MNFTDRQIEIIEAAKKLIGDKGVQNLTIKNLAAEMSFSEPALYRHFKNKVDILNSVLVFYKEQIKKHLSPILKESSNGLEKINSILKYQFAYFSKHPAIVLVIFSETSFQNEKILSKTVLEIMNQKKKLIGSIIQQGQADGSIIKKVNHEQLATIIMGSMRLTILQWRLSEFNYSLVKKGEILRNDLSQLIRLVTL